VPKTDEQSPAPVHDTENTACTHTPGATS